MMKIGDFGRFAFEDAGRPSFEVVGVSGTDVLLLCEGQSKPIHININRFKKDCVHWWVPADLKATNECPSWLIPGETYTLDDILRNGKKDRNDRLLADKGSKLLFYKQQRDYVGIKFTRVHVGALWFCPLANLVGALRRPTPSIWERILMESGPTVESHDAFKLP